jgi:HK97 family phage prohead protease
MSKTMEIERKVFHGYIKAANAPEGIVEAIVSVFGNEDDGGDVVKAGAFATSLQKKLPKGVWMHDWEQPVAKTLEGRELAPGDPLLPEKLKLLGGLYIKSQFNLETQRGREAFSDIQFGIIDEFSIGYYATKVLWNETDWTRELIECELFEWSPVLVGMNRETALLSAKSADSGSRGGLRFAEQIQAALDAAGDAQAKAQAVLARAIEIKALRQKPEKKVGKVISQANADLLKGLSGTLQDTHVSIRSVFEAIDDLVDSALGEPEDTEPGEEDADAGKASREDILFKARKIEMDLAFLSVALTVDM